ncbi:MAG: hypothetical protein GWO02_13690 [Gammaproteobacteria bacterium]|nr:hypothetical protein [Gammaproteobacteria bacterium]
MSRTSGLDVRGSAPERGAAAARLRQASAAAALLDHPLAVVRWLHDALAAEGAASHPGDLLSPGTLIPLRAVRPGLACTRSTTGSARDRRRLGSR